MRRRAEEFSARIKIKYPHGFLLNRGDIFCVNSRPLFKSTKV